MVETKQFSQGHERDEASALQLKTMMELLGEGLDQVGLARMISHHRVARPLVHFLPDLRGHSAPPLL